MDKFHANGGQPGRACSEGPVGQESQTRKVQMQTVIEEDSVLSRPRKPCMKKLCMKNFLVKNPFGKLLLENFPLQFWKHLCGIHCCKFLVKSDLKL